MRRAICDLRIILLLLAIIGIACPSLGWGQAKRRLGTIGPPPRKSPQRQTSAEAFPPLPLPVTPLRRSEPKAEPAPPLFVGKLAYGSTQDYMPNPGDVDNLMRHSRAELGLWYGWKIQTLKDLIALQKQGKRSKLPMLYMTGYQGFTLSNDQRASLRRYILQGGTLMGDATLGSPAFTKSFRNEIRAMFPKRSFDLLQVDHPIYRAYHRYTNVHYFDVESGISFQQQGPPELLGMNVGTRTAVIFTPHDMTCGWDEFIAPPSKKRVANAPRDKALIPGDALRLGVNIVSYVASMREVAEVESVTRQITAPKKRARQQFVMAQLRHNGDWNPDPNSTYQWLRHLSNDSSLSVSFKLKHVDADEKQIADYPFLFMTGFRNPKFTDREVKALKKHIASGGFLFINNCSGYSAFDQHARALVGRLFPDQKLARIDAKHSLFNSFYKISQARDRRTVAVRQVELEGITVNKRLVLVYSKNDMITHLKQVSDPFGNGYDAESCRRLALNVVSYALQH